MRLIMTNYNEVRFKRPRISGTAGPGFKSPVVTIYTILSGPSSFLDYPVKTFGPMGNRINRISLFFH